MPWLFLLGHPQVRITSILFRLDNQTAIHCIMKGGSSRSTKLLWMFPFLTHKRQLTFLGYLPIRSEQLSCGRSVQGTRSFHGMGPETGDLLGPLVPCPPSSGRSHCLGGESQGQSVPDQVGRDGARGPGRFHSELVPVGQYLSVSTAQYQHDALGMSEDSCTAGVPSPPPVVCTPSTSQP